MEEEENPPKPTMILLLTEERAGLLCAALIYYQRHLRGTTATLAEGMVKELGEQSRMQLLHPTSVEGIAYLQTINRLILTGRETTLSNEEQRERHTTSVNAAFELQKRNIPVHIDAKTGLYRFGNYLGSDGE